MTVRFPRRLGVLAAALAATAALVAPSAATAATTEVKKVGATIIYKNAANPTRPGNCGMVVILEWKDPTTKGFEPVSWTGHYFYGSSERKETTISGSPPFHNTLDIAHTTFVATGGANWFSLGWKSRAASPAAGYPLDCSDQVAAAKERYGTQAWVDVTGTMSTSSTAKCLAARKSYDSASKKVTQLRRDLRKAKTDAAKAKIRTRLNTAVRQRAQAAARAGKACSD